MSYKCPICCLSWAACLRLLRLAPFLVFGGARSRWVAMTAVPLLIGDSSVLYISDTKRYDAQIYVMSYTPGWWGAAPKQSMGDEQKDLVYLTACT